MNLNLFAALSCLVLITTAQIEKNHTPVKNPFDIIIRTMVALREMRKWHSGLETFMELFSMNIPPPINVKVFNRSKVAGAI